jgi:hypothetical protein
VLVSAQVLAALGGSGAAAGALLALEITGSESLACLPLALLVVGSSASASPCRPSPAGSGGGRA